MKRYEIKKIKLKELQPTTELIAMLQKKYDSERVSNLVVAWTNQGVFQIGTKDDIPSGDRMGQGFRSGADMFEDAIATITTSIDKNGYKPEEYGHIKVFFGNYIIDGCKRLVSMNELFDEEYELEVKELFLD